MEELVLIPIEEAVTAILKGVIEASVEGVLEKGVTAAVDTSIAAAIADMIATTVGSQILKDITIGNMTDDVVKALQENLAQSMRDALGESGVRMLGEAISATPSQEVTETLYQSINTNLWAFHDTDFVQMERFVRFVHALENGDEPPKHEDPEPEENTCRIPELYSESVVDDILGFMVFGNEDCEGDIVNGFGVQWNKLLKLIDDPVGGSTVKGLLNFVFERYPLDEAPQESVDFEVLVAKPKQKVGVKVLDFGKVSLGNKKINNVHGSSVDKLVGMTWIAFWRYGYKNCPKGECNIKTESPKYEKPHDPNKNVLGGHVWLAKSVGTKHYYILPICSSHNAKGKWDFHPSYMLTKPKARALKIDALKAVLDKTKVLKQKLKKGLGLKLFSVGGATDETGPSGGTPSGTLSGGPPSLDPFQKWLKLESFKLAQAQSAGPIKAVMKQITTEVLSRVGELIKDAGSEALSWLKSEGRDIMLKGLIPIYGEIQAGIRLSHLKADTMKKFSDGVHTKITAYCHEMKGDHEQKRRRKLLNTETQKVTESHKWKADLLTFDDRVRDWVQKNITY